MYKLDQDGECSQIRWERKDQEQFNMLAWYLCISRTNMSDAQLKLATRLSFVLLRLSSLSNVICLSYKILKKR